MQSSPPFASLPAELLRLIAALPLDGARAEPVASAVCYRSEAFVEDLPAAPEPEAVHCVAPVRPRKRLGWMLPLLATSPRY